MNGALFSFCFEDADMDSATDIFRLIPASNTIIELIQFEVMTESPSVDTGRIEIWRGNTGGGSTTSVSPNCFGSNASWTGSMYNLINDATDTTEGTAKMWHQSGDVRAGFVFQRPAGYGIMANNGAILSARSDVAIDAVAVSIYGEFIEYAL